MKLNAKEIAAYEPPAGKDHIVFDLELAGFGLRYRNGRKTWVFQYAFGSGEGRVNARMTLGEYPALPPAKARDTAEELYARFGSGSTLPLRKGQTETRHRNTFGKLVSGYLAFQKTEVRPSTYVVAELYRIVTQMRCTVWRPVRLTARRLPNSWRPSARIMAPYRPTGPARPCLQCFRGRCDGACTTAIQLSAPKSERSAAAIGCSAIPSCIRFGITRANDYDDILRRPLFTGQRAGEIGGLGWSEIDFDECLIHYPPRTENGQPHSFPMSKPVRDILKARPHKREFVFGRGNGGFSGWNGDTKRKLDEAYCGCGPCRCRTGLSLFAPHVCDRPAAAWRSA